MAAEFGTAVLEIRTDNAKLKKGLAESEKITRKSAKSMSTSLDKTTTASEKLSGSFNLLDKAAAATGLAWISQVKAMGEFLVVSSAALFRVKVTTTAVTAESTALAANTAALSANAAARTRTTAAGVGAGVGVGGVAVAVGAGAVALKGLGAVAGAAKAAAVAVGGIAAAFPPLTVAVIAAGVVAWKWWGNRKWAKTAEEAMARAKEHAGQWKAIQVTQKAVNQRLRERIQVLKGEKKVTDFIQTTEQRLLTIEVQRLEIQEAAKRLTDSKAEAEGRAIQALRQEIAILQGTKTAVDFITDGERKRLTIVRNRIQAEKSAAAEAAGPGKAFGSQQDAMDFVRQTIKASREQGRRMSQIERAINTIERRTGLPSANIARKALGIDIVKATQRLSDLVTTKLTGAPSSIDGGPSGTSSFIPVSQFGGLSAINQAAGRRRGPRAREPSGGITSIVGPRKAQEVTNVKLTSIDKSLKQLVQDTQQAGLN